MEKYLHKFKKLYLATRLSLFVTTLLLATTVIIVGNIRVRQEERIRAVTATTTPVAYWKFDENTGDTISDSSGNGNNGIINGAAWTAGKAGRALQFDGINDYVDTGNGANLNIGNAITISAWIYPTEFKDNYNTILYKGDDSYGLRIYNGTLQFVISGYTLTTQLLYINNWYHVVATYDRNQMKIYLNGAYKNFRNLSYPIGLNSNNVKIGSWTLPEYSAFSGIIDEVKIYNRILSDSEVLAEYLKNAPLQSVSWWENQFLNKWNDDDTNVYRPLSVSFDSWDYYNLAFGIDANTAMYKATGKTQYLDRSLLYINNVIARAKPSSELGPNAFGDSYLGWVTQRKVPLPDLTGQEIPLFETFMWRYVTEVLWTIHQTPVLYNNPTYKSQYDNILAFTEVNIFDKWYNRGDGPGGSGGEGNPNFYRQNTNMAANCAFVSLNLSMMTQNLTRKSKAITVYTNINLHMPNYGSSLRQQFHPNTSFPMAYNWNSVWGSTNPADVQDVPHGSNEVSYIIESYDRGIEWTDADITALSHTLTDVIWKNDGTYAANVDGTGSGNGIIMDGFMKLGRYNPAIQKRLETYTGTIRDNYNGSIQYYGNGALNAKYAAPDIIPPIIFNIQIDGIAATGARITWKTDEASDTKVIYGLSITNLDLAVSSTAMSTAHAVSLSGLKRRTTYYYKVISKDASGNQASSRIYYFKTLK